MIRTVSKYRWIFSLRGILAIVFGLATLLRPPPTLGGMVLLLGLFGLLEALLAVVTSFGNGEEDGHFSEDVADHIKPWRCRNESQNANEILVR